MEDIRDEYMASYCVLTCDVKNSKNLKNWPEILTQIENTLEEINKKFNMNILIEFKITVGDEFQGVLKTPENAYNLYLYIKENLSVDIYCGIGTGEIEGVNGRKIGLRGSAFYRARDAIELCKKKKRAAIIKTSEEENTFDNTINTLMYLIYIFEKSWTKRQKEVLSYYRFHRDLTYEEVGKHFGISKQSISQILSGAEWSAVSEGENLINKLVYEKFVKRNPFTKESKVNMLYKGERK